MLAEIRKTTLCPPGWAIEVNLVAGTHRLIRLED
jgi:hypothetical protein